MSIFRENDGRPMEPGAALQSTMSLVGRLEDLSLGEILQIVSLSKRSGLIWLEAPREKAKIYIREGKVIYAARSDDTGEVASLLVNRGLIEPGQIDSVRREFEDCRDGEQLRRTLEEKLGISAQAFHDVLKEGIQELVYSLFNWEEGTFSFQLLENETDHPLLAGMSPFFLDEGIGAQFLVMEGARRKDELGREPRAAHGSVGSEAGVESAQTQDGWEEEFEQQFSVQPPSSEKLSGILRELQEFEIPLEIPHLPGHTEKTILVIGLDPTLTAEVTERASARGFDLLVYEDGADGLTRIQEFRQSRANPFLLLDIEAAGITDDREAGGLEILSTLWDLGFSLHVGLVCRRDLPARLLEKMGPIPGVHLFVIPHIPGDEKAADRILDTFEKILSEQAAPGEAVTERPSGALKADPMAYKPDAGAEGEPRFNLSGETPPVTEYEDQQTYYDIRQELSDDLEGIDLPLEDLEGGGSPREKSLDPHMDQLTSYVNELNRQDISGEITLLALRFASFFVSRAVLFLVRKDDLKGLGQFGVDLGEGRDAESAVRSLTLGLGEKGPLNTVVGSQRSYKGPPTGSETEKALFDALGGGIPGEIFVGPIISMGKVAVLLYGDDHPVNTGIEPTHTLDIFLSHVGLALDRAFLEMKLKTQR